jgi:hypothetical protein
MHKTFWFHPNKLSSEDPQVNIKDSFCNGLTKSVVKYYAGLCNVYLSNIV